MYLHTSSACFNRKKRHEARQELSAFCNLLQGWEKCVDQARGKELDFTEGCREQVSHASHALHIGVTDMD